MASVPYALRPVAERLADGVPSVGRITALNPDGTLMVQMRGSEMPPIPARLAAPYGRQAVLQAIAQQQDAIVVWAEGCAEPIVTSFLVPTAALAADAPDISIAQEPHRLVLRAGDATVILHDTGKVEIRGIRIAARADEDHRILGRMVRIN